MSARSLPWNRACIEPVPPEKRLDHVRYCSPFAAGLIDRHPEWLEQLAAAGRLDEASPPHPRRADEWIAAHGLDDGLRGFRNQELLRIAWRDLNGLAGLGETLSDLTRAAEVCLRHAVDAHHARLSERHGRPRSEEGESQQPVVLALGKLGGGELNFSSDVDLIICFPAAGRCDGGRPLSCDEYFVKLARAVISTLGDAREAGFCYRVDTRLRPFGHSGPLACSFASMEQYYQREGRDWERYALVKSRCVAGHGKAGARLLEMIRPFVYRRYIDFGAIEALREMQAMVRADAARRDRADDIKRGRGGIREIEFLAQGFQLLRGGRDASLQTSSLHRALERIASTGLLPPEVVSRLGADYLTLRHIENRLQAMRDQQTHRIPSGDDLDRLVAGMGRSSRDDLAGLLADVRERVARTFDETWAGPADAGRERDMHSLEDWRQKWAELKQAGGEQAEGGGEALSGPLAAFLARLGSQSISRRAGKRLDDFMPLLLERCARLGLSKEFIGRLLDLVLVITQRSAYLALLVENPRALDRMIDLFGRSPWLASRVSRFPELLDELIDPALGQHIPERAALEQSVERQLALSDEEARLSGLNYLKQATCLRVAVAFLEQGVDAAVAQQVLSELADVMIGATLKMAREDLERRHGTIAGAAVAVIAYGSLGARELGFESDLDLVFLYRPGQGESDGPRPLAPERWYARLAQRMLALLTAMTPSGRLYEVDTRLRPNGRSGFLVSSLDAFEAYQFEKAWTWEAQALTRARPVAGDGDLARDFQAARRKSLCRPREGARLRDDLLGMRERILESHGEGESPAQRLKHCRGGLVDIEFIAQAGVLSVAAESPEVIEPTGTAGQLEVLRKAAWLEPEEQRLLAGRLALLVALRLHLDLETGQADPLSRGAQGGARAVRAIFERRIGP